MHIKIFIGCFALWCFLVPWHGHADRVGWAGNDNLTYADILLNQGYLTGLIINKSSEKQTDITVHIRAFTPDKSKMVLSGKFSIPAIEPKESHFFKIPCAISADPVFEVRITTPTDEEKRPGTEKRASPPRDPIHPVKKARVNISETSGSIEIKGRGSMKSDFFPMKEGTYVFRCTLDTDDPFSLRILDGSGWVIDQITHEGEGFAGSREIEIETEGRYLVDVIAAPGANWSISVEFAPGPEKTEEPPERPVKVKVWVDEEGVTHATDSP